jgi:antitoxin component HigA of HigAB toxin-antitoxin module
MTNSFNLQQTLKEGHISNLFDYKRAMIADRILRLLAQESTLHKAKRKKLRNIIEAYEKKVWQSNTTISNEMLQAADEAEHLAEMERVFLQNRKEAIRKKLKRHGLTQADLATLLGHKSKTHMSELMNGITPFTLRDLIIIHRVLKINITQLVPVFLSSNDRQNINQALLTMEKPSLVLE